MDVSAKISKSVVQCLGDLRRDEELLDFTVKVGQAHFACHKVLLAACSKFFYGLLRSDMTETRDNCVTLHDISPDTFQLILDTIYNGVNVVTDNNFIELWKAVHQLQIDFMIDLCENFAIKVLSLKTLNVIHATAKLLSSQPVSIEIQEFMIRNLEDVNKTIGLYDFTSDELFAVIESQDLNVSSEDTLLEIMLSWIESNFLEFFAYLPDVCYEKYESTNFSNDDDSDVEIEDMPDLESPYDESEYPEIDIEIKSKTIVGIFKRVRMCLVSVPFLQKIYVHNFIKDIPKAKKIIFNAVLYQTQAYHHGQWPTAGIHRTCSQFDHLAVVSYNNGEIYAYSVSNRKWYNVARNIHCTTKLRFVAFKHDLYCIGICKNFNNFTSQLYVLNNKSWERLLEIPGQNVLVVSHGNYIYTINKHDSTVYILNPTLRSLKYQEFTKLPANIKVENIVSCGKYILSFSSTIHKGFEQTTIHRLDVQSKKWTHVETLEGPAREIISFRDDKFTYILQTNGCLWLIRISLSGDVQFVFKSQLWSFQKRLYGALTYRDELYIFGNDSRDDPKDNVRASSLPGFFSKIVYMGTNSESSNFIPVTLSKEYLIPIAEKQK